MANQIDAQGQFAIVTGAAQGIGYALTEEVVMRDGRMANAQLTNYIIPTPMDAAPIDVGILERPYAHGPFGAKGVGEAGCGGSIPAVTNAVLDAELKVRGVDALRVADASVFPSQPGGNINAAAIMAPVSLGDDPAFNDPRVWITPTMAATCWTVWSAAAGAWCGRPRKAALPRTSAAGAARRATSGRRTWPSRWACG